MSMTEVGTVFTRLTVLQDAEPGERPPRVYVRCTCGTEKFVERHSLTSKRTKSCGCLRSDRARMRVT